MGEIFPCEALEEAFIESEKRNADVERKLKQCRRSNKQLTLRIQSLEQKLIRSDYLVKTGLLATSIAHEINSPLQAIAFVLDIVQKRCVQDSELSEKIDLLKNTFADMRTTVQKLLELNRPCEDEKREIDVNRVLENTVDLFRIGLKRSSVDLKLDLSAKVPKIAGFPHQLRHVFLNLLNNAHAAVEARSESCQKRAYSQNSTGKIEIKTRWEKGKAVIQVADNGPGIPEKDLNRIFDAFFTRNRESGVGLGLAVSHGFIKNHGGVIKVGNLSPEGGAVFTVELPGLTQIRQDGKNNQELRGSE